MSIVLPRLARSGALAILEEYRESPIEEVTTAMPIRDAVVTYSPVGGQRITQSELAAVREAVLAVSRDHGMPGPISSQSMWEGRMARLLHERLRLTPHEAAQEEVWSYLTCCWLLDVAMWRFSNFRVERFIGHLNRNTFRRQWWRAEVLGPDVDLELLGEDELVAIMERPSLFSERPLARAIALELIERTSSDHVADRMKLMREATKRLLRLTPFISFSALDAAQVCAVVADAFDAAAAGLTGAPAVMPQRWSGIVPPPSSEARELENLEMSVPTASAPVSLPESARLTNFDEVANAALAIARSTGRVTNIALREVVPVITAEEAREVFRSLIADGKLVRRGVRRGTHYVIPAEEDERTNGVAPPLDAVSTAGPSSTAPLSVVPGDPMPAAVSHDRPSQITPRPQRVPETALRRLLRRMR